MLHAARACGLQWHHWNSGDGHRPWQQYIFFRLELQRIGQLQQHQQFQQLQRIGQHQQFQQLQQLKRIRQHQQFQQLKRIGQLFQFEFFWIEQLGRDAPRGGGCGRLYDADFWAEPRHGGQLV